MGESIRISEISIEPARGTRKFGPFTSAISAAALIGLYIGVFSIVIDKF